MRSVDVTACHAIFPNSSSRPEMFVAFRCAPVLKGIKTANLAAFGKGAYRWLQNALSGTGVACMVLAAGMDKEMLLLYRYGLLEHYLSSAETEKFLTERGYGTTDAASVLGELKKRYMEYDLGRAEFPHELGVVLNYPVRDVREFIRKKGRDFLISGYWKVYTDPAAALATFCRYDEARRVSVSQLASGCALSELAVGAADPLLLG